MAYSDWTLETVKKAFHLEEVNAAGIFSDLEPDSVQNLVSGTF